MSASNCMHVSKKIKPIEHPDLVLKTPIAYHGGTDLSVIPIDKDGLAVCARCGAMGVKHAFYTKKREFCSLACSRASNINNANENGEQPEKIRTHNHKKQVNYQFKLLENTDHLVGMIPMEPLPQLPGIWQTVVDDFMQPIPYKTGNLSNTYEWHNELLTNEFLAAPIKLFAHAPLSDMCNSIFERMKVEVKNTDYNSSNTKLSDYYWVATVLKLKGYMGLLRYEGFGNDESKDFWLNLMNADIHPVGWCATRGKPLIPPQTIDQKYSDWKSFLVQQLTGARTLPSDFYNKVHESLKSRFRVGHRLEIVDKNRICQVKVATVHEIIGKRLHIRYYNSTSEDNGFWCHEDCSLIHPVGWARQVGHMIEAPSDYLQQIEENNLKPEDTTPDLFKNYVDSDPHKIGFKPNFVEGMKVEAIDPLNLSSICVATVMKVLLHGYIMIRIDCYPPCEAGSDWFCYHQYSPCIFPTGFCEERGIPLTVAAGQPPVLNALENSLINSTSQHGFLPGMRLECADLMDPRLVCVATIAGVVGRLLKVHFNGWSDEYDQWLDCESTDIYPVGWCQAIGHKLEGPNVPINRVPTGVIRKKGRKKKYTRHNYEQRNSQHSLVSEPSYDISNSNEEIFDIMSNSKCVEENNDTEMSSNISLIKQNLKLQRINNLQERSNNLNSNQLDFGMEIDETNFQSNETNILFPEISTPKVIPRLVGNTIDAKTMETLDPENWNTEDVAQFLRINDCAPYCTNFCHITGRTMLELSKDEIIELLKMKVGPSLKIYDLIQQLKCKLKPVHARNKMFK